MAKRVAYGKSSDHLQGMLHPSTIGNGELIALHTNALRIQKVADATLGERLRLLSAVSKSLSPTTLALATYDELFAWQTSISRLSTNTVATYTTHVKTFYGWCVRPMSLLTTSPAEGLVVPHVPETKPRPVPESDVQYALLGTADGLMRVWLLLARYAGLRCCEISALRRDSVIEDPPPRLLIDGKGRKQRMVFIPAELRQELQPWMRHQGQLFTDERGRGFLPGTVSKRISIHLDQLGLPYTAHQFRHSYGTDGLRRTKDARLVQTQMGHASMATTQGYIEPDQALGVALAEQYGQEIRKLGRGT